MRAQYEMIKGSRAVLLDYCDRVRKEDFLKENSSFGRGSIRNLLVHNAFTYQWWIGINALGREIPFPEYPSYQNIAQVRSLFDSVDSLLEDFFEQFESDPSANVAARLGEKEFTSSPLELFTHAISHEFHHKGQILSLSRHLGYVPVDTDVIR